MVQTRRAPSSLPVMRRVLSVRNERVLTPEHSPMVRERELSRSQTRILPSNEYAASLSLCIEIAMRHTQEQFSPRIRASPVRTFHKRTVSSQLPDASSLPPARKAINVILRVEPPSKRIVPV